MKFPVFIFINALLFLGSCTDKEKLAKLQLREEQLTEREKEFSSKEAEYQTLLKMRDSLKSNKDSIILHVVPEYILGRWKGKMICTESNCPENMIGDQRSDIWEFSQDEETLSAKVTSKSGGSRIYSGIYTGSELKLKFKSDSSSAKRIEINILLKEIQNNRMKGTREILGENNCISRFSLEMEKSKN